MRGRWAAGVMLVLAAGLVPAATGAEPPRLTARAAIAVDAASGATLWERDADDPLPPASTTKIVTAIVALESGRLDESFRVSGYAADTPPSRINLQPGQRMRLRHLLYPVLLNSANDAAVVVAEGLAGSESKFADEMNVRARTLGATHSHFENPHGLTEAGHVASARDLAIIFRHGLGIPLFREFLSARRMEVPLDAPGPHWLDCRSHNRLLTGYTYRVIGKTGYTRPARRCFVGAASDGEREVIVAVLGATDLWGDTRRLIEHALGRADERPPVVMARRPPAPAARSVSASRALKAEGDDETAEGMRPRFAVQLGPYRSRRTTEATRTRLAQRGYTATVEGRALRLGQFTSRTRAAQLASRLRLSGYRPTIVALN